MTILGIETSTKVCSAALVKDGETLRQEISLNSGNHAGLLPVYIEQLLAYAREQGLKIDAIALSEGPGSYTGLRIGLSTAKGLCYGLDVPLIAVPTTEVMCEATQSPRPPFKGGDGRPVILCPMIDARRMEVYTALYRYDGEKLEQLTEIESRIIADGTWPTAEEGTEIYYFGDGAEKCRELLENEKRHYIADIVPEAQYIKVSGKWLRTKEEIAYYEPFYLKEFQAAPAHVKGLR